MLDATRVCELLVGLPAVRVLDVVEPLVGRLEITVESIVATPTCGNCGGRAWVKSGWTDGATQPCLPAPLRSLPMGSCTRETSTRKP